MLRDKIKLFPHQAEAIERALTGDRCLIAHDMGLGKTYTMAEIAMRRTTPLTFVFCQASKVNDWVEHFQLFYSDTVEVYDLTEKKFTKVDGVKRQYPDVWYVAFRSEGNRPRVLVCNYELITYRQKVFEDIAVLGTLLPYTVLCDEVQKVGNEMAKRSKLIKKMTDTARYVILGSGTPADRSERLLAIAWYLNWKVSKGEYWDTYINYKEIKYGTTRWPVKVITGYRNTDRLLSNLHDYGAQFLKTGEVLELPEQLETIVRVKNTKEYKKFLKEWVVDTPDGELIGDSVMAKRIGLKKLAGAYNENKISALRDILESTDEKTIIFYTYNAEKDRIIEMIDKMDEDSRPAVYECNGATKTQDDWVKASNGAVLLVQYQSGAEGLNLQSGRIIIYFSLSEQSLLLNQSKKRTHRIGQTRTCLYYYLICDDTIDEDIQEVVEQRMDYTDKLFMKKYCPIEYKEKYGEGDEDNEEL